MFEDIAKSAKKSALKLQGLTSEIKNKALEAIWKNIEKNQDKIFEANKLDLNSAQGKIPQAVFNRLKLDENKMRDMIQGIKDVIALENPVNRILMKRELDNNLILEKISCPIGVLGIIFEARPDVMAQISSLAIKSSNAVILKGGKESINTNKAVFSVITEALQSVEKFPDNAIFQIFTHDEVAQMLKCEKYIDLIIPRGGNNLVKFIKENTKIPVLGHADGICHLYIDKSADLEKAQKIAVDAKCQYPSACNSIETLLIHKDFNFKDELITYIEKNGVKLIFNPEKWNIEHSDKILSVKTVESIEDAIFHINEYGSHHTDAIVTEDENCANLFLNNVDSSGVYKNASTRFADGFRYGFGAEVGISTNKTHARGPVGLEGLTIYKYTIKGDGNIVSDYANGQKHFIHKDLL